MSSGATKIAPGNGSEAPRPGSGAGAATRPGVELVDFIYRDGPRINSLHAQLFNGLLTGGETSKAATDAAGRRAGLSAVAAGAVEEGWAEASSGKEARPPHDATASGLIATLRALGRISDDVPGARPGTIIRATGRLFLLDAYLVKEAIKAYGQGHEAKEGARSGLKKWAALVADSTPIPNAFVMMAGGFCIGGIIAAEGMHEPIAAAYLKHGVGGLDGVELIAIKESASIDNLPPADTPYTARGFAYVHRLQAALFPDDAIRVSPVAIYRSVH